MSIVTAGASPSSSNLTNTANFNTVSTFPVSLPQTTVLTSTVTGTTTASVPSSAAETSTSALATTATASVTSFESSEVVSVTSSEFSWSASVTTVTSYESSGVATDISDSAVDATVPTATGPTQWTLTTVSQVDVTQTIHSFLTSYLVISVSPTSDDLVPASETSFPASQTTVSLGGTVFYSGFGTGTGTTSFYSPTNGTYTVPSATATVVPGGAMALKIAGANVVGAAAAALVANFI